MSSTSRHTRISVPLLGVVAAALLIGASSAGAAQRYAAPGAGATGCSQPSPCDLQTAVELAGPGDEVIVTPGTYPQGGDELDLNASNLVVRGVPGQPKPLITSSATNAVVTNGSNEILRDLRITQTGGTNFNALFLDDNSIAERLEVTSDGYSSCSVFTGALVRDSLCINSNAGGAAVANQSSASSLSYIRNVTAVATGTSGTAISVSAGGPGATVRIDARNVIAVGPSTYFDADITTTDAAAVADLTISYTNLATARSAGPGSAGVTGYGDPNNQNSTPPIFVDAAAGNYHQATGSPTINAGATDARTGSLDLDGQARVQGTAIDIGADEFTVVTPPPSGDTTPPETTISRGPKVKTKKRKATFRFSSNEAGSSFECSLDHRAFVLCPSPKKYGHLRRRRHSFAVRAVDAAGNADTTPATYRWKVKKRR